MNELKIFENKELNLKVRAVKNDDGSISINAEDTAIGFGWTQLQKKNGKEYTSIRWETLNNYCGDLGFPNKLGKDDFIPESLFYMLGMKANNETAMKYQKWLAMEVLPSIRKHGYYETPKSKAQAERLASVNNAVKILTPMLEKAGCNSQIQLLTAKQLYEKAGVLIPIEIQADKQYYDTVHIARQAGIFYKSSGKPADKAVNEIIRRVGADESEYTETWEAKGNWQGTVRKYSQMVIDRVIAWISESGKPTDIKYIQSDGQEKAYHVTYKVKAVA